MKNLFNLFLAFIVCFFIFFTVVWFAPIKTINEKDYKIIFGSPVLIENLKK